MEPVGKALLATIQLLDDAVRTVGSFVALSERTGISRRRLGYIYAGQRQIDASETFAIQQVIEGKL